MGKRVIEMKAETKILTTDCPDLRKAERNGGISGHCTAEFHGQTFLPAAEIKGSINAPKHSPKSLKNKAKEEKIDSGQ